MNKENIIYGETTEEYKAIKWLENKITNYSDDGLTLHYNLILYNLIINLNQQLKKKQDVIDKAIEYIESNSNIYLNIMGNKVGFFTENNEGHVPIELLDILKEDSNE